MLTHVVSALSVTLLSISGALAAPSQIVDDLDIINLRVAANSIQKEYHYPGLDPKKRWDSPDCLVLIYDKGEVEYRQIERLIAQIEVADGDEILFGGEERTRNPLNPRIAREHIVYPIRDLSRYVTGLEVRSKNGKSLRSIVSSTVGDAFVGLQVLRKCRVNPFDQ